MKPFEELTRVGKIRRMRSIARVALEQYGLEDCRIEFLRHPENPLFRIIEPAPARQGAKNPLFVDGRYLLRVHNIGGRPFEGVELVLEWLAAMRREAGLPVPEPVPTLEGRLLSDAKVAGVPGGRRCSLLRWLRGRYVKKTVKPCHLRAQGRLMARLHGFAAGWTAPRGLDRRDYDADALFADDDGLGIRASEAWAFLPDSSRVFFETVAGETRRLMDAWGKDPRVYGLIHGDLGVDANVLFWRGEARAIDFDDARYGYYMFDLAVALEHCFDDAGYDAFRRALLQGYREIRALPDEQAACLELFLAAFSVYWSLWAAALLRIHPEYAGQLEGRLDRYALRVKRFLSGL